MMSPGHNELNDIKSVGQVKGTISGIIYCKFGITIGFRHDVDHIIDDVKDNLEY